MTLAAHCAGKNHRIALVGFAFAIMLAVVAPGGSNFVIAGAILISMNLLGVAPLS